MRSNKMRIFNLNLWISHAGEFHFVLFWTFKIYSNNYFLFFTDLQELRCEVAIKIIKSRKPFMQQAQTEIALLMLMLEKDK